MQDIFFILKTNINDFTDFKRVGEGLTLEEATIEANRLEKESSDKNYRMHIVHKNIFDKYYDEKQ